MKKILLVTLFLIIGVFLGWGYVMGKQNQPRIIPDPKPVSASSVLGQPISQPQTPLRLKIPKIGVDAKIEAVGLDKVGKMDVPKKAEDIGWYSLGVKPGEIGNAVMAGHLDRASGAPAVFWNLTKLKVGDKIQVLDEKNNTLNFKVVDKQTYADKSFPLQKVFGAANKAKLNLITCQGSWDGKNYSNRQVIYTERVE